MSVVRFDPIDWAAALEQEVVTALNLVPTPCPLAAAMGTYKGGPAALAARTYVGPTIAYARFVTVEAGEDLHIANILAVAPAEKALPILGADLVKLGGARPPLLAADAWPTDGTADHPANAPTPETAAQGPPWWQRWSSPAALFLRVQPEHARAAHDQLRALVRSWLQRHALGSPVTTDTVKAARRTTAYLAAHREEDQTLALLGKMFGVEFAARFVAEVLFPNVLPPRAPQR